MYLEGHIDTERVGDVLDVRGPDFVPIQIQQFEHLLSRSGGFGLRRILRTLTTVLIFEGPISFSSRSSSSNT